MSWYNKYMSIYEKPYDDISTEFLDYLKDRLGKLQSSKPITSLTIIALNEETRLLSCLWALSDIKSRYPIEIFAVDNGSTDRTPEILERLGIKYYKESRKSYGHARQCGLEHAKGKYTLCIDSDTLYPSHYVDKFVKELNKPGVVCVSALTGIIPDEKNSRFSLAIYEAIRDIHLRLLFLKRPELSVRGMSLGFHTDLGKKYGFRTGIKRGEDGSMALALKKEGKIRLITSSQARLVTRGNTRIDTSHLSTLWHQIATALKNPEKYFRKREYYDDDPENLLDY